MYFDLGGQTAIVTGAAQGIGEGIAKRLAKAGAQVVVADRNAGAAESTVERLKAAGLDAFPVAVDVTDASSIESMVKEVLARTGQIDIFVNNAGIGGKAAPIWEQSDDDWQSVINVNLTGVFLCCRAVIGHMRERDYGRIVNIASVAGKDGNPNMTAYSASKAAVIGLTKSIAKEVAEGNICVNSVTPAVIRTPILEQLTPHL